MIPAPGRSLRLQPLADHARTSIDAYLAIRIKGEATVSGVPEVEALEYRFRKTDQEGS
jgi:hypothetical protein